MVKAINEWYGKIYGLFGVGIGILYPTFIDLIP
jgi:hypothetical protein